MLPIQFTGHKVELTAALKDYTEDKFKRIDRHAHDVTSIHVTFVVDKLSQIAEAKIAVTGTEIYAKAESDDMYKTIDLLIDKLVRQLDKHKGKRGQGRCCCCCRES